ncbi:MAG: hypothetical protein HQL25_01545 [Candidatus Omnitrophica bacterium]|nr:hypothetical protein [Candidatus Omnitrophota bacterium]
MEEPRFQNPKQQKLYDLQIKLNRAMNKAILSAKMTGHKITKDRAREIALGHALKNAVFVYTVDEVNFNRQRIYGFDNLAKRWEGKAAWCVIYPEILGNMSLCSSNCVVIDKNTGEILADFCLNDEG